MILYQGELFPTEKQPELLSALEAHVNRTLAARPLSRETVVRAADALGARIAEGLFDDLLRRFAPGEEEKHKAAALPVMRREALEYRIRTELGDGPEAWDAAPPYGPERIRTERRPLGTLFHIAAGNVDGLPAFSVLEGLLTGNVNILKLPQADSGLTIEILRELIRLEPSLAEYIYVFDTPSSDAAGMRKMAALADGIVLWGGEEATRAVRALAPTGARLIEWGHRLGFAYISGYADREAELAALAAHVAETKQLLCSSCQTIYLDTDDPRAPHDFCREFLPILSDAVRSRPSADPGDAAQAALRAYCLRLEHAAGSRRGGRTVYAGDGCSLTVCPDRRLELSDMYGNLLVKALPVPYLLPVLRRAKGTLQTAALIAAPEKRRQLTELLLRAGVQRVMKAGDMSLSFCGEAHDGTYPLRQYTRFVHVEL